MGVHNLPVVDIGFAFATPGYSHIVAVDILGKHVLGGHNLGKVDVPVGEDLDKVGTLGIAAVGNKELDMVCVDVLVVVDSGYSVQECFEVVYYIAD